MDSSMIEHNAFLIIDAGGTYVKSAALNYEGEVLKGSSVSVAAFSDRTKEEILYAFRETIIKGLRFINKNGMRLDGICVAFPGPFNYKNGIPLMDHKFLNIRGIKMRDFFHEIPGVSSELPIIFVSDAQAVLLGELWKGNAQGFSEAAVVTLGTGLGFAFSKGGIIQSDKWGAPLVTIFRLPYKDGILEDYTARKGFLKIYNEISGNPVEGIDVSDLGKWADKGDEYSIKTFRKVGSILSEAIHEILYENKIQCLLLGGQISRSFKHLEETLKLGLLDIETLQKISVVRSIENASLFGALREIKNSFT